jgi:2-keto-3-deoxy-L-rhamnonate aldolase RhmA
MAAFLAPPTSVSLPAVPAVPAQAPLRAPARAPAVPLVALPVPGAAPLALPLSPAAIPALPAAAPAAPSAAPAPAAAAPKAADSLRAMAAGVTGSGADGAPRDARAPLDRAFDNAGGGGAPENGAPVALRHEAPAALARERAFADALAGGGLAYGVELLSANPVSAQTLASHPAVAALVLDASKAERGELSAVVKSAGRAPAAVLGRFSSADDAFLKPKVDEGLAGALLAGAGSLKETLKFLDRLYLPPLGRRTVGPNEMTEYLGRTDEYLAAGNARFVGGVTISDARGVRAVGSIVKAKARGLKLIEVDEAGIARSLGVPPASAQARAAVERVEAAARAAGIPLAGRAPDAAAAAAMHARGYRLVVVTTDAEAVDRVLDRFDDAPYDPAVEAPRGMGPREWLDAGLAGFLGFLNTPDENLARVLASRTHALWIDAEAGQFPLDKILRLLRALPRGRRAVVRTTGTDNPDLEAYIRGGAAGVVAPQVQSAREARRFVERVKRADPRALAVVMIETRRGLENAEEIARVPGVDAVFIGPHDLSLSLGLSKDDPRFAAALSRIEAAARAAGVPLGGLASSRSQAYALRRKGYLLLATVMDQAALRSRLRAILGR